MKLELRSSLSKPFQYPVFTGVTTEFDESKIKDLYDAFFLVEEHYFPNGNEWIAGENITVADFAFVGTISSLIVSFYSFCRSEFVYLRVEFHSFESQLSQSSFHRINLNFADNEREILFLGNGSVA